MRNRITGFLVLAVLTLGAATAHAYIGPGAGLSVVGAFWGLVLSLFAALFFIVMWPLRKALRQRQTEPYTEDELAEQRTDDRRDQGRQD